MNVEETMTSVPPASAHNQSAVASPNFPLVVGGYRDRESQVLWWCVCQGNSKTKRASQNII